LVKLAYSAPKVQLGVDSILDRIGAGRVADRLYLVLDYSTRRAWIECGDSMFYAPEAEDGAGTFFRILSRDLLLNPKDFVVGIEQTLLAELSSPGTLVPEIAEYCRSLIWLG